MSRFQAEQLAFAKVGVRPALKVSALRYSRMLLLLLQNRAQSLPDQPVQTCEHVPFGRVFEVFKPADQRRVRVLNCAVDAVSVR